MCVCIYTFNFAKILFSFLKPIQLLSWTLCLFFSYDLFIYDYAILNNLVRKLLISVLTFDKICNIFKCSFLCNLHINYVEIMYLNYYLIIAQWKTARIVKKYCDALRTSETFLLVGQRGESLSLSRREDWSLHISWESVRSYDNFYSSRMTSRLGLKFQPLNFLRRIVT